MIFYESRKSKKNMIAHFTLQGEKPHNEDFADTKIFKAPFNVHPTAPMEIVAVAVLDGHGHGGEGLECSTFCAKKTFLWVESLFYKNWEDMTEDSWKKEATELTKNLHDEYRIVCSSKKDRTVDEKGVVRENSFAVHSGTTFSLVLIFKLDGFYALTIQVGDSNIYINDKRVVCDHSPLSKEENARIQKLPEKVKLQFDHVHKDVFLPSGEYDPFYFNQGKKGHEAWNWKRGITPNCALYTPGAHAKNPDGCPDRFQLAMTRSLGDYFAHPYGVTTEPCVTLKKYTKLPIVYIATDGAFDTINEKDLWIGKNGAFGVDLSNLLKYGSLQTVVEQHVRDLRVLGTEFFGKDVDDISVAVFMPL